MAQTGYVKLFRSFLDWEWFHDHNTTRLFLFLLLKANFKASKFQGCNVPAGAMVTGYAALSKQTGLSVKNVRTALKHLKNTGEVAVTLYPKFSIISITNWADFQGDGRQAASKRQASGKQAAASKEGKEYNNKPPIVPQGTESQNLFSEFWAVYPDRNVSKPKKPAWEKWVVKVKAGADPQAIIAGATAYAGEMRKTGKFGTEYVQQPSFWLNQERWADYADIGATGNLFVPLTDPNFHPLKARFKWERKADPPDAVQAGEAGALFPAQWVINSRQAQHATG